MYTPFLDEALLRQYLAEDMAHGPDLSGYALPEDAVGTAHINTRQDGVISGLELALAAFKVYDPSLQVTTLVTDGTFAKAGTRLATVKGAARSILASERTALNLLGHLSGIATTTHAMASLIEHLPAQLVDTRKTTPGLRRFEKQAVRHGGGQNHRFGLDDAVMLKDNHIAFAGSLKKALQAVRTQVGHMVKIEVEVDTLEQLEELLAAGGADVVLLDNMPPATLKKAVSMVNGQLITEASGNISPQTVVAVAQSGVDLISAGYITHSAPRLDVGLDI